MEDSQVAVWDGEEWEMAMKLRVGCWLERSARWRKVFSATLGWCEFRGGGDGRGERRGGERTGTAAVAEEGDDGGFVNCFHILAKAYPRYLLPHHCLEL